MRLVFAALFHFFRTVAALSLAASRLCNGIAEWCLRRAVEVNGRF